MDNLIPIYKDLPDFMKPLLDKYGMQLCRIKAKIKRGGKLELVLEAVEQVKKV